MTKNNWLENSLKLLAKNDFDFLKIDNLCKELQVTKGSFYHHFKNYRNFLEELLEYWYQEYTVNIIKESKKHEDNVIKQIEITSEITYSLELNIEIQFRAMGLKDILVQSYIKKIDAQRIELIKSTNAKLNPKATEEEIDLIATYIYTQFIGSMFLQPKVEVNKQKKMDEMILDLILNANY